ncbi:MAG TPA: hypothetical protein VFE23_22030 [Usitatibacter sp.]|jgi:uncharacterized membrane-anchored protein|nr:hypothetical protein [Usitatibacter sp.]
MRSLPRIDRRYWLALSAASIFGTNTGDFVAGYLHIGHLAGLPWLLVAFALILFLERISPVKTPLWFWAAIITVRTAATNVGDAFHDFGMGFAISVPVALVLFVLSVALYARLAPTRAANDTVQVTAPYWGAMMLAGVLGTVGGDAAAKFLSNPGAAVVFFALAWAAIAYFGRRHVLLLAPAYWTVVALIRTAGTAGGDTIAHAIGLAPSTVITGLVFLALIIISSRSPATPGIVPAR